MNHQSRDGNSQVRDVRRHGIGVAATAALLLLGRPAAAADGATCASRFDSAQAMIAAGKLLSARATYLQCAQSGCPEALRGDCVKQYEALARRIPSVIISARSSTG